MEGLRLLILCLACAAQLTFGAVDLYHSHANWDGSLALFPVPRAKVAAKLEELKGEADFYCGPTNLILPREPILPNPDLHVVAVSFGKIAPGSDLGDDLQDPPETIQFFIPFLAQEGEDDPAYKLALGSLVYNTGSTSNPNPNIPAELSDVIAASPTSVVVRDGEDELVLSIPSTNAGECVTPDEDVQKAFEAYNNQPTFSFDTQQPCFCQFWTHEPLKKVCETAGPRVASITPKFEQLSLLSLGDVARMNVANAGDFQIGIADFCFWQK